MKKGILLVLIAVCVLVAAWIWINIESEKEKLAIKEMISYDRRMMAKAGINLTGDGWNKRKDMEAAKINFYVENCKKRPNTAVPKELIDAYYIHLSAWSERANILAARPYMPDSFSEAFGQAGLDFWTLSWGAEEKRAKDFNKWKVKYDSSVKLVSSTWKNVERLCIEYGVHIYEPA